MTTRLTELSILFLSVVKWFLLASAVGLLVGLSSTLFEGATWGIKSRRTTFTKIFFGKPSSPESSDE